MSSVGNDKLDKYDFLMGAVIGIFSGLMDAFFVGKPGDGMLTKWTDKKTEDLVIKFAEWKTGRSYTGVNAKQNAIQALEKITKHKIPYDQATTAATGGMVQHLSTINHHVKSLGHSPDLIGLCFSILDQFQNKSTFINDGRIIRVDGTGTGLEGTSFIPKVYAGTTNWFMHLMSYVAGSSGAKGRGSGLNIPFYEMFGFCDFGAFGQHRQTLATVMVQVFEQGYDLRHGIAMSIPVLTSHLLVMMAWSFKRKFYHNWEWRNCIPSDNYKSYRRMQLINSGAFCLVDGVDAYIRGKGNPVTVILHMNLMAWLRLVKLIIKEILLTYNKDYEDLYKEMVVINNLLEDELAKLKAYDYAAWQIENELLKDFNKLLDGKNDKEVGDLALDYIFESGAKVNYSNFNEFSNLFRNNQALF